MNKEETFDTLRNKKRSGDLVVVSEILPDKINIVPVKPRPIFPNLIIPLVLSGKRDIEAVQKASDSEHRVFGVVMQKEEDDNYDNPDLFEVGTVMKIHKIVPIADDTIQVIAQGLHRFEYIRSVQKKPLIRWEVRYHYDTLPKKDDELKPYVLSIISNVKELMKTNQFMQEQLKMLFSQMTYDKPHVIMDMVASILSADPDKLQELLETYNLYKRAEKLLILLKEEIEVARVQEDIQNQINEKVSKQQKEYFLREQLKVIKKELGMEKDDKESEIETIKKKMQGLTLTEEAKKVVDEELEKLSVLERQSPEYHVSRNYLHELTSLPWGVFSTDSLDIKKARSILDDQHYGLEDVKKLILQFISTIIKNRKMSGNIICLVGPPGVGKTSVGHSIADALNRKFYRFSVGGMRDEAEIKGHRRTYIGAMPGKIMQSLKRTGTSNPVIMIDEIDKIGMSYQGDPASALLEVLDPEQNKEFLDHYLDVRFDLSNILFITTANQLDTIPRPMLDRMEIIHLAGYVLEEKVQIAKKYLLPRQMKQHGLKAKEVHITDSGLAKMVDEYAREAGVRSLENLIKKVMRQVTLKQAEGETGKFNISIQNLHEYLGNPAFTPEQLYKKPIPGVTLGLAWTAMGGTTLYIEASSLLNKGGGFKQTGQLGKVMQESSEIAFSYVRSILSKDKKHKNFFNDNFVHLHVPAGAIPKDGPSAGITMALALYSLAINKGVRTDIAMTGELTLTGRVLPIGGVKEKTIAGKRVKVKELIFPKDNQKDFDELPDYIKEGVKVHFVEYFGDILKIVYNND